MNIVWSFYEVVRLMIISLTTPLLISFPNNKPASSIYFIIFKLAINSHVQSAYTVNNNVTVGKY